MVLRLRMMKKNVILVYILQNTVTALPKLAIIATLNGTITEPKLERLVMTPNATP